MDALVAHWGKPDRYARFEKDSVLVEVLKYEAKTTNEGVVIDGPLWLGTPFRRFLAMQQVESIVGPFEVDGRHVEFITQSRSTSPRSWSKQRSVDAASSRSSGDKGSGSGTPRDRRSHVTFGDAERRPWDDARSVHLPSRDRVGPDVRCAWDTWCSARRPNGSRLGTPSTAMDSAVGATPDAT
jgi:hypothetical protein